MTCKGLNWHVSIIQERKDHYKEDRILGGKKQKPFQECSKHFGTPVFWRGSLRHICCPEMFWDLPRSWHFDTTLKALGVCSAETRQPAALHTSFTYSLAVCSCPPLSLGHKWEPLPRIQGFLKLKYSLLLHSQVGWLFFFSYICLEQVCMPHIRKQQWDSHPSCQVFEVN